MLQILRFIVVNDIEAKENQLLALEQSTKSNLLTRVEIEDLDEDKRQCIICTEEYGKAAEEVEEPESAVKLPCGHVFGEVCIKTAFQQLGWKCTYCRKAYNKDESVLNWPPKVIVSPWWMEWLMRPAE